ncbi:hypothetical protein VTK56DRAFT_1071 [Thermocarpiscus australiensis]
MASYTITEPHPTVPMNSYTHSGRGGLGNFFRAPATTSPSGVPTPATTSTTTRTTSRSFYSGRGGAGNAHAAGERPVLSFDEEFTRAEVRDKTATISHVGRGGAGNIFSSLGSSSSNSAKKKKSGDDAASLASLASSSRRDSTSTDGSQRSSSGFWGRLSGVGH